LSEEFFIIDSRGNGVKGRHLIVAGVAVAVMVLALWFGFGVSHNIAVRTGVDVRPAVLAAEHLDSAPPSESRGSGNALGSPVATADRTTESTPPNPNPAQGSGVGDIDPHKAAGSKNAPITMEVFSDFQCPACKQLFKTTTQPLTDNYVNTNKVYLVHRDFPLPMHAYSRVAARYARAAAALGKAEQAENALFTNQEKWEQTGDVDRTLAAVFSAADMAKIRAQAKGTALDAIIDKDVALGKSYNVDFSIQRELPGGWIIDAAYVGRFARNLPQAINLTQSPYMFTDSASGQSFAQAYDLLRALLRSGVAAATIPNQPFFENQFKGIATSATQYILARQATNFSSGNVSTIFLNMGIYRRSLGLQPFNNDQSQVEFMRTYIGQTNYNGGLLTVAKRFSHGLFINANYTLSKAIDNGVFNQNNAGFYQNSFYPGVETGRSPFDRKHVFNLTWIYDLPAGKGHMLSFHNGFDRILGGWYISGIASAWSGVPLIVSDSSQSQTWGDATALGGASGAIQTGNVSTGLNAPIAGTGFNFFSNNKADIVNFRPVLLSLDGRSGRANPITGLPFKNVDFSLGKVTQITERVNAKLAMDMFNALNHPNFANPSQANLNITNPNTFGTINASYTPPNRTNSARWIQLSIRLEF